MRVEGRYLATQPAVASASAPAGAAGRVEIAGGALYSSATCAAIGRTGGETRGRSYLDHLADRLGTP